MPIPVFSEAAVRAESNVVHPGTLPFLGLLLYLGCQLLSASGPQATHGKPNKY